MTKPNMPAIARRTALAFALAAGAVFAAAPALAQSKVELRFSCAAPPSDFLSKSMELFKTELEKAAPGQFDVKNYPASQLFRQGTEVPAIQRGNLEMSTMTTFEVAQQIPSWGFLNRAFLFRDWDHVMKFFNSPIGERYRKDVAEKMGIVILSATYLGTRQVNLRAVREVKGPGDLAGVKLRMPAGPDWLLLGQVLGVSPTPMAMPEVYLALQTGSMDGQENPLTIMRAAKYHEVTKQVVLTSHLVQPVFYALSKKVWDKLSDAQKKAVQAAAVTASAWNAAERLKDEKDVADVIKKAGLRVDAIDLKLFRDHADKIYGAAEHAKPWDKAALQQVIDLK